MGLKSIVFILSSLNLREITCFDYFNNLNFIFINNENELYNYVKQSSIKQFLITYNTNVIIKEEILDICECSYNIHAASPEFPGRDPHHWAIYRKASEYGATLHEIDKLVDSGSIIQTKSFKVTNEDTPYSLLEKANKKSVELLNWVLNELNNHNTIKKNSKLKWSGIKTKRSDFLKICDLTNIIDIHEFELRIKAFYSSKQPNLFLHKFNHKFYLTIK